MSGVVIVTGAASGIGAAVSAWLGERGHEVIGFDRTRSVVPGLAGSVQVDVTDADAVATAVAEAATRPGGLGGVVTCAGIIEVGDPREVPAETFRRIVDVNVAGTFLVAREAARHMTATGGGSIVTISSVSGLLASPRRAAYSASKGAVIALTRSLALDLAASGIRVNCVAPGSTETPLMAAAQPGPTRDAVRRAIPLDRAGRPDEIAAVVAFLLSDESGYVTGQTWAVDGGQSIQAGWRDPEAAS